ncbi:MAG: hypothetical protein U0871_01390 [Gemmataceae bacterium]
MTDTVTTTPFPMIAYGVKNRLSGYETCTRMGVSPGYGMTTAVGYQDADFGSKALLADYGIGARSAGLPLSPPPAHSSTALAALPCGSGKTRVKPSTFYSGCVRRETATEPTCEDERTTGFDLDIVSKVRCKALAHTRRELFSVHARVVAVLVQWLRAMERDEISRPVCLPERRWAVLHECGHHGVNLLQGECSGKTQTKPAAAKSAAPEAKTVYPVADDIYEPVEHWWTPERARVLEALKDYTEATHADR